MILVNGCYINNDLNFGKFEETGNMVCARSGHLAALLPNGAILIAGGYTSTGDFYSAELFTNGHFSSTGTMNNWHQLARSFLLPNGKVLILDKTGSEIYDPAAEKFTVINCPDFNDNFIPAVLLQNGKILIVKGNGAKLFDPDSGLSTFTDNLPSVPYSYPSVTLLSDGKVLIAGGRNDLDDTIVQNAGRFHLKAKFNLERDSKLILITVLSGDPVYNENPYEPLFSAVYQLNI